VTVSQYGYWEGFGDYAEGSSPTPAQRATSTGALLRAWLDDSSRAHADIPEGSLDAEPVDLYGKYEYRAPLGFEGNWVQQDAYACGVILTKLGHAVPGFQCPVAQTVTAGLLAPPDARMSLAQAAAALAAA
jgi:hypothetical protein